MRILVGTCEIGGQIPRIADGFRRLGHQVTTVISYHNAFSSVIHYDVDITKTVIPWPEAVARSRFPLVRLPRAAANRATHLARVMWLMANHDVFFIQYAASLLPHNRDFPILKRMGKRIVSYFVGDDTRHLSVVHQQYGPSGVSAAPDALHDKNPLSKPLHNLRMAERHSDLVLSVPGQAGLAVRPYMRGFGFFDLSNYSFRVPGRDVPVVVHAPTDKGWKGTEVIVETLERLRSEGVPFELRLLHGVPQRQVLAELEDADVAVDQLYLFFYGLFGTEAMASGCALATSNREDYEPIPPNRPILHIDRDNIYGQLKRLLTDKELRTRLAHEGRAYVERHHDRVHVARQVLQYLEGIPEGGYDFYPTFFSREYRLPAGEVIPDYLKRLTAQVVQRWGLPEDVDPRDMIARGLMSADGLEPSSPIPRWKLPLLAPRGAAA